MSPTLHSSVKIQPPVSQNVTLFGNMAVEGLQQDCRVGESFIHFDWGPLKRGSAGPEAEMGEGAVHVVIRILQHWRTRRDT